MEERKCGCGGESRQDSCAGCHEGIFAFWCDSCERSVPEKRCPYCGLKARKKRSNDPH
jgi:predicted RNA-binding protein with PUA domain